VLLHSVQTCWRGECTASRVADAAQLLVYWGLPLALWRTELGWIAVAGLVLCTGNRLLRDRSLGSLWEGLGGLLESTFTLLVNTLSFARVGAFALAHAALESAVMAIAATTEDPLVGVVVIVVGNLIVVVVESVVVMIQTTRLILFEFFVRFFEGHGRAFSPAGSPGTGQLPPGPTGPPAL
jgi:V/A-type H+/Na+-transporting ATPase subunit I